MEGFTTKKQQFATVWKMHTAGDAQWYPAQVPGNCVYRSVKKRTDGRSVLEGQ